MALPLIGLALGAAGLVGKMFGRGKANKQLGNLLKTNPVYKENPLAQERLGLARTLLNAKMPGSAAIERNIFSNQATTQANVNRNVTDSSQALALAAGLQGQTNQDIQQLGLMEAQDAQRRQANLWDAQEGVIREGDKVFDDEIRRFQDKAQIQGAMNQNRQANWGDVSNIGFSLADFGMAGGFDNMFGGGRRSPGAFSSQPLTNLPTISSNTSFNPSSLYSGQINYPIPNFYNRPR